MQPAGLCTVRSAQGEERDPTRGWRGGLRPDHAGEGMRLLSPSSDLAFPGGAEAEE